jgi:hypothetical protein
MTNQMRLCITLILATELATSFFMSCNATPVQPETKGPIRVVEFPEPWVKWRDGTWVGVNDNVQYVVRKSKDSTLLFAVKQGFDGSLFGKEVSDFPVRSPNYDYYADTRFVVSMDGQTQVRKVTEDEWNASEKVLHSYYFIPNYDPQLPPKDDPQVTPRGVKYNGRLYLKTGESWGKEVALVSPHKIRIAIFSYTSREKISETIIPGLKNTEPGSGEVFLDVYDLSSGDKVGAARSPYGQKPGGFEPSLLFGASAWIEDRYIIMPLDWELTRCLVGVFPSK